MKRIIGMAMAAMMMTGALADNDVSMVVGTYTDTGSQGIYSYVLDQESGAVKMLSTLKMKNPSFVTFSADKRMLYAVSENTDETAAVAAISFDKATGEMRMMQPGLVATKGGDPCYVATDGRLALTANYSGGSMSVFPLKANGELTACSQVFEGHAAGLPASQDKPHVHTARFMKDGSILATDFSVDHILGFKVKDGVVQQPKVVGKTLEGSAPRHLEFSADERFVYAMSELGGTVTVFKRSKSGKLKRIQTIASDSVGGRGGADIHMSQDGKFLYASNRLKEDGIGIFKVDQQSGMLTKVGYQLTGIHPRNFAISPNDKLLLCACRDSNRIQVFSRDADTGLLKLISYIELPKPVCIAF